MRLTKMPRGGTRTDLNTDRMGARDLLMSIASRDRISEAI